MRSQEEPGCFILAVWRSRFMVYLVVLVLGFPRGLVFVRLGLDILI